MLTYFILVFTSCEEFLIFKLSLGRNFLDVSKMAGRVCVCEIGIFLTETYNTISSMTCNENEV